MSPGGRRSWLPGWLGRLLLCLLITQVAIFMVRPVLTYRVIGLGGGEREVGLLVAVYAVLPALVAIPIGRYSDRHRPAPVLFGGILLLLAGCGGLVLAGSLATVAAATVVLGLGALAAMVGAQMVVARKSGGSQLDHHFGLLSAAVSVGQMIGPALAGVVVSAGMDVTATRAFVLGGVLCAVALLACWGFADPPHRSRPASPERRENGSVRLLRLPGVAGGMLVSVALLTAVDVLIAYLPLLGEQRGLDSVTVGLLLSLRAAASVVSRLLIPSMLARWGRVPLLLASVIGTGVLVAVLPLTGQVWLLGILLVTAGFFLGIGQPLTMASVVQAVPAETRGAVLSIRIMANKIGQVVVPAGLGLAAGATGAAWAFPFLGAVLLGSAFGVRRRRPAGPPGPPPGRPP